MSQPAPRIRLKPGDNLELIVTADFHQYWACDSVSPADFALGDTLTDGVIAPQRTGLQFNTGVQFGEIRVGLHAWGPPPPEPRAEVAAACDLEIESGKFDIASFSAKLAYIDWGKPVRVRLYVGMSGRDTALASGDGSDERHDIYIWATDQSRPRYRSHHIDHLGSQLAYSTDHVEPAPN